jgi:hypothetical protein
MDPLDTQRRDKQVLLIIEKLRPARQPQKNHLLVFGVKRELAMYAYDPHVLLEVVNSSDGLALCSPG